MEAGRSFGNLVRTCKSARRPVIRKTVTDIFAAVRTSNLIQKVNNFSAFYSYEVYIINN